MIIAVVVVKAFVLEMVHLWNFGAWKKKIMKMNCKSFQSTITNWIYSSSKVESFDCVQFKPSFNCRAKYIQSIRHCTKAWWCYSHWTTAFLKHWAKTCTKIKTLIFQQNRAPLLISTRRAVRGLRLDMR